jgi:ubiquinol oxidase
VWSLASSQFLRNLNAIFDRYEPAERGGEGWLALRRRAALAGLPLNATKVDERERARGLPEAPALLKLPYFFLCRSLDVLFEGRPVVERFFFLETVARMPYFSYISCLHLYETLGWWRRSSEVKRVHFEEEWNEFHHLLIMEALGGDQRWAARALAQHAAVFYYFVLLLMFAVSPSAAYLFSVLLEGHAVDT